jgi:hypothetical protein
MTDKLADKYAALVLFYCKTHGTVEYYSANPQADAKAALLELAVFIEDYETAVKKLEAAK